MPIIVTPNNTGRALTRESWNWVAHQSYLVTGVTDENSALNAVGLVGQTTYTFNSAMILRRYWAENYRSSPTAFTVHAEFAFGDQGELQSSPINEKPKRIWQPDRQLIPVDYDTSYNPFMNSASDFFEQPVQRPIPTIAVVFQQYIPYFNVSLPFQFQDHVNSDAMNYVDIGPIDPGQSYCDYIKPLEYYTSDAPYVHVEYRLRFLPNIGSASGTVATSPWQPRVKDVGRTGWYTTGGKTLRGPIVDSSGTPSPTPVMLNGQGKPILAATGSPPGPGWWILGPDRVTLYAPVNNPNLPTLNVDSVLSNANQMILILENIPSSPFSMMGIA